MSTFRDNLKSLGLGAARGVRATFIRVLFFVLAFSLTMQFGASLGLKPPDATTGKALEITPFAIWFAVTLGLWFASGWLTGGIGARFWPDESNEEGEDDDSGDAAADAALATVAAHRIWDWFIPIYFRRYVRFMALGIVMFGALFLFAFLAFRYGHLVGDSVKPPDERALPIVFLVPFFAPFAWLALGYAELFASERRQAPHGLFWRFNILNGTIFWGALWLLGFAGSLVVPPPHSMPGGEALLSLIVSLPMLIGMSALAASTSFAGSWLRSGMR